MDGVARAFGEAHGEIPTDIIAVDLAAVEAFLGRIGDPEATPGATVPERDAGLRAIDTRYFVLLPWATPLMRRIEGRLRNLPFGAQYVACGVA